MQNVTFCSLYYAAVFQKITETLVYIAGYNIKRRLQFCSNNTSQDIQCV